VFEIGEDHFKSLQSFVRQFEVLVPAFEQEVFTVAAFELWITQAGSGARSLVGHRFEHAHDELFAVAGQVELRCVYFGLVLFYFFNLFFLGVRPKWQTSACEIEQYDSETEDIDFRRYSVSIFNVLFE
jgi:hypothetical protein